MALDTPDIETTQHGGMHTRVGERWDLLPYPALQALAECMHGGTEKYGERNYHKISVRAHINHGIRHAFLALEAMEKNPIPIDPNEDHLMHAATRLVFALEMMRRGDPAFEEPR